MSALTADKKLFSDLVRDSTKRAHAENWDANEVFVEHMRNMLVGDSFGYPVSGDDLLRLRREDKGLYR